VILTGHETDQIMRNGHMMNEQLAPSHLSFSFGGLLSSLQMHTITNLTFYQHSKNSPQFQHTHMYHNFLEFGQFLTIASSFSLHALLVHFMDLTATFDHYAPHLHMSNETKTYPSSFNVKPISLFLQNPHFNIIYLSFST